jgi:hypothetical protein
MAAGDGLSHGGRARRWRAAILFGVERVTPGDGVLELATQLGERALDFREPALELVVGKSARRALPGLCKEHVDAHGRGEDTAPGRVGEHERRRVRLRVGRLRPHLRSLVGRRARPTFSVAPPRGELLPPADRRDRPSDPSAFSRG